uniref:EAL domain-containing protein n=1 Tax=unclassified Rhodococcus (in: high G+C Gram-positive bacteria) TaxID=192944 RepID=UPI0015961059|nr:MULTISPECIES: EAL domain-containing protein [unclassified Rhodococcus (in: high G+C Gram-positive bacteria)]
MRAADDRIRAADDRAAARSDRVAAGRDRKRSAIDGLTGAYRRDAGRIELQRAFDSARRDRRPMVIGFLDVDGLKAVNDERGHAAGDETLRSVAAAVRDHLHRDTVLVRFGGDEFVFSVLDVDENSVHHDLVAVEAALRTMGTGSISYGIAVVDCTKPLPDAIEAADADLYSRRQNARFDPAPSSNPHGAPTHPDRGDRRHRRGRRTLHVADEFDQPSARRTTDIAAILQDPHSVRPVYQPIVDLDAGIVVGYEALARWPLHPAVDPTEVFTAAADSDELVQFDWACRAAAIDGALEARLPRAHTLFLNVEPDTAGVLPDHTHARIRAAGEHFDIVLELTERSLLSDPASLLRLVDRARRDGCRIAIDDVGCHRDSLAMLEFIAPEIIKLDRSLVQHDPNLERARAIATISAHAESTGAMILAEGIETQAHLERGLAYGAVLGQGWMFGRPAPLPHTEPSATRRMTGTRRPRIESLGSVAGRVPALPSDVFDYSLPTIGRKPLVATLTRQIERHAQLADEPLVILATFQNAQFFDSVVAARYAELAASNTFVAVLGVGMSSEPAPGVRGTGLRPSEPFTRQWTIAVVGQHYFAAVVARDLGDSGDDNERRFEFLHTHDRSTVVAVARSLMQRVTPMRPVGALP